MRTLSQCALLLVFALSLPAGTGSTNLTVVLEFKGPHKERSVSVMKHETESLLHSSGLRVGWRDLSDGVDSADRVVVMKFKGACTVEAVPYVYDERGPLAFTYTTDGYVQPFGEVSCDKVAATVRSAMWGRDFAMADMLMGRALGRVVTHELVHILTGSGHHAEEGVQRAGLSGRRLISPSLGLDPDDVSRIREKLNAPAR